MFSHHTVVKIERFINDLSLIVCTMGEIGSIVRKAENSLYRAGKAVLKTAGAVTLATMFLTSTHSDARPRKQYAQHQVQKKKKQRLTSHEHRVYDIVKDELRNNRLPEDIAPVMMGLMKKEKRFWRHAHRSRQGVRQRINKLHKLLYNFNGLICASRSSKGKSYVNILDFNDALEYSVLAYTLEPEMVDKIMERCALFEDADDFSESLKSTRDRSAPLSRAGRSYSWVMAAAEMYSQKITNSKSRAKPEPTKEPLQSEDEIFAEVLLTGQTYDKPVFGKAIVSGPEPKPLQSEMEILAAVPATRPERYEPALEVIVHEPEQEYAVVAAKPEPKPEVKHIPVKKEQPKPKPVQKPEQKPKTRPETKPAPQPAEDIREATRPPMVEKPEPEPIVAAKPAEEKQYTASPPEYKTSAPVRKEAQPEPLMISKPQPEPAKPKPKIEAEPEPEPALVPVEKPEEKAYTAEPKSIDDTIELKEEKPENILKEEAVAQKQEDLEAKVEKEKPELKKKNMKQKKRFAKCRQNYTRINGKEYLKVRVKHNESPWSLSDKYTGKGINYKRIRRYGKTPIDDSHPLQPGEKVYVPKNILKREYRNKGCYSKNGNKRSRARRKRGRKNYSAKLYNRR